MDAPRYATTTRHWAYPWGMGASVGTGCVGLYYLAYYFWGWQWDVRAAVALWLTCLGVYPFLHDGAGPLGLFLGAAVHGFLASDDDQAGDDGAPGPGEPRATSPLVGGGLLDEAEQYAYHGLLLLFQHAAAAGSLTSTALIPAAFTDPAHWGYWTNLAAYNGLCLKANGVTTTLPSERTYAWAIRKVLNGDFAIPPNSPAPLPWPHPFKAGLVYKAEAGKAGKGGPKVKEVDDDD